MRLIVLEDWTLMPRLFTGLEIPPDIGAALQNYRAALPGVRWIEQEDYHITLRYAGDIDYAAARDLAGMLEEMRPRGPLRLSLNALDSFGGHEPRSLIVRVAANPVLHEMQAEHERMMRRLRLPLDKRKFIPHVTLARLRDTRPEEVANFITSCGIFPPLSFTARRFVLFSSKPSMGGGPYVQEATYSLL
jgi:RNA 2',3'-cyclic 3'-phosphodiesterase